MKRTDRILLFIVIATLILCFGCEKKETAVEEPAEEEISVRTYVSTKHINKFGNVDTEMKKQELYDAGFELGDILTMSFLGQKIDAPLVTSYSDVVSLSTGIFALDSYDTVTLAINMGDFASYYGIADKSNENDTVVWTLKEGAEDPVEIVFTMKEKGGYLDEYMVLQLKYTNEREDYSHLSDEEFANFRNIATTGMGKNALYRSSTTVDDIYKRAKYADSAAKRHHIALILNVSEDEANLKSLPGYEETYFASVNHLAININLDVKSEENKKVTAEFLRCIASNKGPYLIQCLQGKDRTGIMCAILECLMGATYDEIIDDYMLTFYNWFGITKEDKSYQIIADQNIINTLKTVFDTDDLKNADLKAEAEKYLLNIGLNEKEIADLKANLSADYPD